MGNPIKALGELFAPKMPKFKPQVLPPLPDPDSEAAKMAARKKLQTRAKGGRAGTIFSDYTGSNLGGTA